MNGRLWTEREDEILQSMLGEHTTAAIAKRLKVPVSRVNNRIARLGLSRKVENVYSAHELSQILGMESNWMRKSILEGGFLPYERLQGRGRFGVTQVKHDDVVAFLATYPWMVDRKKVDLAWQQFVPSRWITTGEAFRRGAPHVVTLEHAYLAGFLEQARKRGQKIMLPESLLPELVERRRTRTDDVENRRQYRAYAAQQRNALRRTVRRRTKRHELREAS